MSPYFSAYFSCVPEEDFELLRYLACHIFPFTNILVKGQNEIRKKITTSTSWCHLAARAVATVFRDKGLEFVDGKLFDLDFKEEHVQLRFTTHTWCRTKNGSILDVAPVGILSFSPLLFAKKEKVETTEWGFVGDRYVESTDVAHEIEKELRSDKFKTGFPVYVSLLEHARQTVDKQLKQIKIKKKQNKRS